jgi:C-terminal processing protease CtpA/Prc
MGHKTLKYFLFCGIVFLLLTNCTNEQKNDGNPYSNLTSEKTEDLAVLCKVWGFLKYYHPVVATGKYNWDKTLIQLIPKVLEAENADKRNAILLNLIDTLGKFEINNRQDTLIKGEIKMLPDLGWITKSNLGGPLSNKLLKIKNSSRTEKNYHVNLIEGPYNSDFKTERHYVDMKFPKREYRLLCLFRYWNIIQYFFPYRYLIEENWHDVLKDFIPEFLIAKNEMEYKKCVLRLTGKICDSHAFFKAYGKSIIDEEIGNNYAPIQLGIIEGKVVVIGFKDENLGLKSGIRIGDIITKVNDLPVEKIIKGQIQYTPASNSAAQLRDIMFGILRTRDTAMNISFLRNCKENFRKIKCYDYYQFKKYHSYNYPDTSFKLINPQIGYIYPGKLRKKHLDKIFSLISETKGLVIDLRCYPLEPIAYEIMGHLVSDSVFFFKNSEPSVLNPGMFIIKRPNNYEKVPNKKKYCGKVVIIVNENAQSAAEFMAMAWSHVPNSFVIGSMTAGADGNLSTIPLVGGIQSSMSGLGIYYPDGGETQRVGVRIDIIAKPTIKGISEGRDELLDKAIELINADK